MDIDLDTRAAALAAARAVAAEVLLVSPSEEGIIHIDRYTHTYIDIDIQI